MKEKEEEAARLYETFTATGQENKRLKAALEGYFLKETDSEALEAYGAYLKRRIRPAVELLMEKEEVGKIALLGRAGYFGRTQLEGFIRLAKSQGRMASLVWLLHLKQEQYGFTDRDFTL